MKYPVIIKRELTKEELNLLGSHCPQKLQYTNIINGRLVTLELINGNRKPSRFEQEA